MSNYVHFERGKEFVTLAAKDYYNTDEVTIGVLPTSLEIVARLSGGEGKAAKLIDFAGMPRTKASSLSTMLIAIINGLVERLYFYARPNKTAAGYIKGNDGKLVAWSSLSDDDFCKTFSFVPKFFSSGDFYDLLTACAPHDSVPHIMGEVNKEQTRGYSYKWGALATLAFEAMRERGDATLHRDYYASGEAEKPVITILPPTITLGYGRDRGYAEEVAADAEYFSEFSLQQSDVDIDDLTGSTPKLLEVLGNMFCHLLPINLCSSETYADTNYDLANVLAEIFGVDAKSIRAHAFSASASAYSYSEGQKPNYTGTGNPSLAKVWLVRNLATTGDASNGYLAPLQELVDQALKIGQRALGDVTAINDWTATSEVTAAPVSLAFALAILFKADASGIEYCKRMQDFTLACNAVAIARCGRCLMFDLPGEFDSSSGETGAARFSVPANVYHKKLRLALQFVDQPGGGAIKNAILNGVVRELFTLTVLDADTEPTSKTAMANAMHWEYDETTEETTGSYNYNGTYSVDLNPAAYYAQSEWTGSVTTSLFNRDAVYTLNFPNSKYNGIKVQSLSVVVGNTLKHSELFDVTDLIDGYATGTDALMTATLDAQFPVVDDKLFAARSDGLEMLPLEEGSAGDSRGPVYDSNAALCVPSNTTFTATALGSLSTVALHSSYGADTLTPSSFRDSMKEVLGNIKTHGEDYLFTASRVKMDAARKHDNFIFNEASTKERISAIIKAFGEAEDKFGRDNVFSVTAGEAGATFDPPALNTQYLGVYIVADDYTTSDGTAFVAGDILTCVISDSANLSSGCFEIDETAGTCDLLGSPLPGARTLKVNISATTAYDISTKEALGKIMESWDATTTFGHIVGKVKTYWRNLWISESKYA